ncbi:antitoxin Xre/MbcA/ParS toxin-binding domain-containing protein [Mucilaginibacter sp.]|jgi:putative toxin-antitoxin system antitoxin component (TIGR02293 family)|uniref:antitoxin Xre/MbcA/ParS toxin-binding domain-containing protein n=1 Tax=Mucilaginibacter sp. TaxID=1882438 RepID=UPI002BA6FC79|nr:antitoxin Xre/MbcA/ParS toxin-binding domain-containing protein [Mucilaginibacter sp.]HTI58449.1 antitoxin Xre/MbcA/ParS toxin-binding domain-containing protein [Mucilaginibacter sp.]
MEKKNKETGAGASGYFYEDGKRYKMYDTDAINKDIYLSDVLVPYTSYFKSPIAKLDAIRKGLQPNAINDLIVVTGATQTDVSRWLDITEPTLRKHIQNTKELNLGISEHIIQLFELFNKGLDTFGSLTEFKHWLKSYNIGIDAVPFEILDTITGIGIIMNELIRIDYGATA